MNILKRTINRIICRLRGHDYGDCVYISPATATYCRRCGREIMDRIIADLKPMTDDDQFWLDDLIDDPRR